LQRFQREVLADLAPGATFSRDAVCIDATFSGNALFGDTTFERGVPPEVARFESGPADGGDGTGPVSLLQQ
jgi:hypothetical protein